MPTFDHSTFLVHRAIEAEELCGPPRPPSHITLPGAKAAITHDRLLAYHDAGIGQYEICERTNARWRAENAARLAAQEAWSQGPYRDSIRSMAELAAQRVAEDQRRRAALEEMLAEWECG